MPIKNYIILHTIRVSSRFNTLIEHLDGMGININACMHAYIRTDIYKYLENNRNNKG